MQEENSTIEPPSETTVIELVSGTESDVVEVTTQSETDTEDLTTQAGNSAQDDSVSCRFSLRALIDPSSDYPAEDSDCNNEITVTDNVSNT